MSCASGTGGVTAGDNTEGRAKEGKPALQEPSIVIVGRNGRTTLMLPTARDWRTGDWGAAAYVVVKPVAGGGGV